MKNDSYHGKHGSDSSASPEYTPTSKNRQTQNFKVEIDSDKLSMGESYLDGKRDYDLDNFIDKPRTGKTENFRPHTEEINSFSNSSAKNSARKTTKAELKRQKKELRRRQKEKDKNNKRIFGLFRLVACLIVGIVLGQYLLTGMNDFLAVSRSEGKTVTIQLEENPDLDTVAHTLFENGAISSETFFKLFVKLTKSDDDFHQGTYELPTNLDYQAIISYLESSSNRSDIVEVRFTEGMNVLEIANKLKENGVITDTERFLSLCNTDELDEKFTFLKNADNSGKYYKLEGYLYPDTYQFYINQNPLSVIDTMVNNYENRVYYDKRRIPGYEKQTAIGKLLRESEYSADEILTIASIIQEEALNTEDMYNISSVIHNRLNADPDSGVLQLACDSTVYYPYHSKDDIPAELTGYVSNYDTYTITGLPAGPICCPGAEAILAALLPNDTDYLYFCHSAGSEDEAPQAYYATNIYDHEYNLELAGLA